MGDKLNLKVSSITRTTKAKNKVMDALSVMLSAGENINFYAVAKKAGVSPNFLYTNTELRKTITGLRKNKGSIRFDKEKVNTLNSFLLVVENDNLKRENKVLKEQVENLKLEIQRLENLHDMHETKSEDNENPIIIPF